MISLIRNGSNFVRLLGFLLALLGAGIIYFGLQSSGYTLIGGLLLGSFFILGGVLSAVTGNKDALLETVTGVFYFVWP